MWFADFETITENTIYYHTHLDTRIWLWHYKNILNNTPRYGVTIESFIKQLFKDCKDGDIVYFHNLTWDGDFILKYLCNIIPMVNESNTRLDQYFYVFRRGRRIYSIHVKYKNKFIIFKCSYLILLSKIRNLATKDLQKLCDESNTSFYDVEPYESLKQVPKKYIKYIHNDVEIARRAFRNFERIMKKIDNRIDVTKHLTLGSITRQIMRNQNKHDCIVIKPSDYELSNLTMRGGLTQFNPIYLDQLQVTDDLVVIDVHSAYPHFLRQPLPFRTTQVPNDKDTIIKVKLSGEIKEQYNNLIIFPQTNDGVERYTPIISEREIYLFNFEFELFKQIYNLNYEILETYYLEYNDFLKEYINCLYSYKLKYEKENNNEFKQIIKILMNSVYGSLCLSSHYQSFMYLKQKQDIIKIKKYDKKQRQEYDILFTYRGDSPTYNIGDYQCFRYDELSENERLTNKLAASYVTAKQRTKLFSTLLGLSDPNNQFIYCDTDSLFLQKLKPQDLEYIKSLINDELGMWGCENQDQNGEFRVLGPKKYTIKCGRFIKNKFAGVNNKDFNIKEYKYGDVVENATMQAIYCPSGIILHQINKIFKKPTT